MELSGRRRRRRFALIVVALALVVAGLLLRSWVGAQAGAATVLATTLETPVLSSLARALTREPRLEEATVAGTPTTIATPAGEGPWPALVFVNGATVEGRFQPTVRRLATGLARAGYLVLVPDVEGLSTGDLSERTLADTLAVAREGAARGRGRVGLVGVSTGATLALLAARDPRLRDSVSMVSGIAPYSDLREVVRIATTGTYRDGERVRHVRADPFLLEVVTRSLGAAPGVAALLANRDPTRFDGLYAALDPAVRTRIDRLSPLRRGGEIAAPVELASGPSDRYFPLAESRAVARVAPRLRVTVTEALDHADLVPSLADLPDLARLDGFVVRSLRFAAGGRQGPR